MKRTALAFAFGAGILVAYVVFGLVARQAYERGIGVCETWYEDEDPPISGAGD